MQKLLLFLSIVTLYSCGQSPSQNERTSAVEGREMKVWHQRDTLFNTSSWIKDSVRQIRLDVKNATPLHLEVESDAGTYLFSNGKLLQKSSEGNLKYSFDRAPKGDVFLSLDREVQKVSFGIYSIQKSSQGETYESLQKSKRDSRWVSDNILLILLIGASIIMVILKINYDKRYYNVLSVRKIFTTRLNEGDQSRVRIMDQDNVVFAGFYAFLAAGLIYFLSLGKTIRFLGVESTGIIEFLHVLLVVGLALVGKVILVAIVSNLFGNNKIPAFYIKEMLNINLFFVIILFFSSVLIFLFVGSIPAFWLNSAIYGMIAFYLIRLILLYFKILKLSSFTNLYLFSYFCTTEIFPFLIGLKYFMR